MRKVLSVMVAAIMLAACLTGCSDSSAKNNTNNELAKAAMEDNLSPSEQNNMLEHANQMANYIEDAVWEAILNNSANGPQAETAYKTPMPTSVESFENSDNPVERNCYEYLKKKGVDNIGYVYIDVDLNSHDGGFVQWCADESGLFIGQRPQSASTVEQSKEITFGQFKEFS